jgi:hypothetical protein
MEHSYIDEHSLIDRYVRGTMPSVERAAFEEHFLDCSYCLEQLEIAKSLREAVRISAADLPASPVAARKPSFGTWLQAIFQWRWGAAVALACLLIVFSPAIVLYQQLVRTRSELGQSQVAFVRELENVRKTFENAQQSAPAVYALELTRGAEQVRNIEVPPTPQWMVFSVSIDVSQFPSYRATLHDSSERVVWHNDSIRPASPDAIGISVPSTVFTSGLYTLALEGVAANGSVNSLAKFELRAVPKP